MSSRLVWAHLCIENSNGIATFVENGRGNQFRLLVLSRDVQNVIQSLGKSISRRHMSSLLERHLSNQAYEYNHNF